MIIAVVGSGLDERYHRTLVQMLARSISADVLIIDEVRDTPDEVLLEQVRQQEAYREQLQVSMADFSRQIAVAKEELPPDPYINGNLSYLYRKPKFIRSLPIRKDYRRPLQQPCWRAGRWKSLT